MVIATVLLNVSCGGGNGQPSAAEIAQIDAGAAAAAWVAPEEGANWQDWGLAATMSSLEAASASAAAGGGPNRGIVNAPNPHSDLPSQFVLGNNRFEKMGIMHNRGLKLIQTEGDLILTQNLIRYDSLSYMNLFTVVDIPELQTNESKIKMFQLFKTNNFINSVMEARNKAVLYMTDDEVIDAIPVSTSRKESIRRIFLNYKQKLDAVVPTDEISSYLNSEISQLTNKKVISKEDEVQIVYLTVLKHSNYYWHKH